MRKLSKKSRITATVAGVALVAVGGGAAYAYWTTTGSGNGSAANSAGGGTVPLHPTFAAGLSPEHGGTTGAAAGALHATVATSDAGCLPAWFTVTADTSNSHVAANSTGTS